MPDIAQLIVDQNSKIENRKNDFLNATSAFAELFEPGRLTEDTAKKKALLNLCQKGKIYFSCVESCIVEGCVAGAFEHPAWLEDQAESAEKVLRGVLTLYSNIRKHRNELGLTADCFEPSGNIFSNMQRILALCRPEKAKELKQQFINAKLPFDSFDKPLRPKPMKPEQNNPWLAGSFYLTSYLIIIAGLIALIRYVPWWAYAPSLIALVLLSIVIGALQLRNDNRLKDESFAKLMGITMKRLVLLKDKTGADANSRSSENED